MKKGAGCRALPLRSAAICSRRGNGTIATCSNRRPILENKAIKNTGFIPQIFTEYLPEGTRSVEAKDSELKRSIIFPQGAHSLGDDLQFCNDMRSA